MGQIYNFLPFSCFFNRKERSGFSLMAYFIVEGYYTVRLCGKQHPSREKIINRLSALLKSKIFPIFAHGNKKNSPG